MSEHGTDLVASCQGKSRSYTSAWAVKQCQKVPLFQETQASGGPLIHGPHHQAQEPGLVNTISATDADLEFS